MSFFASYPIEGGGSSGAVTSVGPFGSTPNADGATITGNVLTLEPASSSFPGGVTTGTQSFSGDKSLSGTLSITTASGSDANPTLFLQQITGGQSSDIFQILDQFGAYYGRVQNNGQLRWFANVYVPNLNIEGSTSGALGLFAAATTASYNLTMPAAQGSTGQVLTNSDGAGTLTWTTPSSSGANTSLSNLTTTSINQSLLPGTSGTLNLGSSILQWADISTQEIDIYNSTGVCGTISGDSSNDLLIQTASGKHINLLSFTDVQNTLTCNSLGLITAPITAAFFNPLTLVGSTSGSMTQAANSTTVTYSIVWPAAQGTSGQVPTNDGSGNLTWTTPSGGGGNSAVNITGAASLSASSANNYVAYNGAGTSGGIVFELNSAANATVGDTYTNNGFTATIVDTISSSTNADNLVATAASGATWNSGLPLVRTSGTGDATIGFSQANPCDLLTLPAGTNGTMFTIAAASITSGSFALATSGSDLLDPNVINQFTISADTVLLIFYVNGTWYGFV